MVNMLRRERLPLPAGKVHVNENSLTHPPIVDAYSNALSSLSGGRSCVAKSGSVAEIGDARLALGGAHLGQMLGMFAGAMGVAGGTGDIERFFDVLLDHVGSI